MSTPDCTATVQHLIADTVVTLQETLDRSPEFRATIARVMQSPDNPDTSFVDIRFVVRQLLYGFEQTARELVRVRDALTETAKHALPPPQRTTDRQLLTFLFAKAGIVWHDADHPARKYHDGQDRTLFVAANDGELVGAQGGYNGFEVSFDFDDDDNLAKLEIYE
jgi:hypothetical protein